MMTAEQVIEAGKKQGLTLTPLGTPSATLATFRTPGFLYSGFLRRWGHNKRAWEVEVVTRIHKNGHWRTRKLGSWVNLEPALKRLKQYVG